MGMLGPKAKMTMAPTNDLQKKHDHPRRDDRLMEPRRKNAIAVDIDRILIGELSQTKLLRQSSLSYPKIVIDVIFSADTTSLKIARVRDTLDIHWRQKC